PPPRRPVAPRSMGGAARPSQGLRPACAGCYCTGCPCSAWSSGLTALRLVPGLGLLPRLAGGEEFHLGGLDQKAGLAFRLVLEGDGLKVAHSGQLAALPGKGGAPLRQRAAHLDGDKVGETVAVPIPVAAV